MEVPISNLHSGCSDAYLDIRSQVLFMRDAPADDSEEASAFWGSRYHHELGHWRRYQGSTIGHLLTLLKYARDITAINGFAKLSSGQKRVINARRGSGVPVWSYNKVYDPALAGEDFALNGQFWLDLYYTYARLLDSQTFNGIRTAHPSEVMPLAIADAWLFVDGSKHYAAYPGNERARRWLSGDCTPVDTRHGRLTTRLLLECGSTIDEVLMLGKQRSSSDIDDEVASFGRKKLYETEYGLAARVAQDYLGPLYTLPTLQALIDFSINPPLPFMYRHAKQIRWEKFYPPHRFLASLEALSRATELVIVGYGNSEEHLRFRSYMCKKTGLLYGRNQIGPTKWPDPVNFDFPVPAMPYSPLLEASRVLLWSRIESPNNIASPQTGLALAHPDKNWYDFDVLRRVGAAFYPFISELHDGISLGHGLSQQQAVNFLHGVAVSEGLDALVNEVGEVSSSMLPVSMPTNQLMSRALDQLEEMTGVRLIAQP